MKRQLSLYAETVITLAYILIKCCGDQKSFQARELKCMGNFANQLLARQPSVHRANLHQICGTIHAEPGGPQPASISLRAIGRKWSQRANRWTHVLISSHSCLQMYWSLREMRFNAANLPPSGGKIAVINFTSKCESINRLAHNWN